MFVSSSVLFGTAIGSMYGYGGSEAGVGYGNANDSAALGGLIGFNIGLAASVALTNVYEPSWGEIGWMWAGAGIGAAVSLPVFLFYAGEDEPGEESPPAKRGFLFMGTATTLGLLAGAVFSSGAADDYTIGKHRDAAPRLGQLGEYRLHDPARDARRDRRRGRRKDFLTFRPPTRPAESGRSDDGLERRWRPLAARHGQLAEKRGSE